MTETIVKPQVNPSLKLIKDYGWILAIALLVAQQMGWLTADQIATIKRVIPVESTEATKETITVTTETKPPEPSKPIDVAAIKPEDIKQWLDLIRIVIDEIKPKPAPVDPKPEPKPFPVDPKPLPVDPLPAPVDAKIVITDETGKALTAVTVDAGALFLATAPGTNIGWQNSKHGVVRIAALPGTLGYAFSLDSGAWVELFLTDYGAKTQTSIRITCNTAPQPPPHVVPVVPVVPDVVPVVPPPITAAGNRMLIVYESDKIKAMPPAQAAILTSVPLRTYLAKHCAVGVDGKTPEARFQDQDTEFTTEGQVWRDAMKLPRDSVPWIYCSNGVTGYSGPLPNTVDETIALCRKYFEVTP